jgi:hypothetical protein
MDKKTLDKAKRQEARLLKIQSGMAEMDIWLRDIMRSGLIMLPERPRQFWENAAERMVDAQAPGMALVLHQLRDLDYGSNDAWQGRALDLLTQLWMAVRGFAQFDALSEATQADLRTLIGWGATPKEVQADPEVLTVRDRWLVIARRTQQQDDITAQRDWLYGCDTGTFALILNFAYKNIPIESPVIPGYTQEAELAFFPSATPMRAVIREAGVADKALPPLPAPLPDWAAAQNAIADDTIANPWVDQIPLFIGQVLPFMENGQPNLADNGHRRIPLVENESKLPFLQLLALSGGQPLDIFLLFSKTGCEVVGAVQNGRFTLC